MALVSQSQSAPDIQRGPLRRPSQNSSSSLITPVVQAVDFCRSKPKLVELEQTLFSLANGSVSSQEAKDSCLALLCDSNNTKEVFNVFCSCSWTDRYRDPAISQLFYEIVNIQQDRNEVALLLAELEIACEELLKVLTHLGTPNTLQLNIVSLLYNLSRVEDLPPSHLEAVQSYLEEIARALWPYSKPSAPDLWRSETFCDAQCDVLKACGTFLEDKCPVNTERTFQKISGKLICNDISQYSRFRLLEIQELRSSGWKLPVAAVSYYKATYQKLKIQPRGNQTITNSTGPLKKGFKRVNSLEERKSQKSSNAVTVLRISESELRKSCHNLHDDFVPTEEVIKEQHVLVDYNLCSSSGDDKLPVLNQRRVSVGTGNEGFRNTFVNMTSNDMNLCKKDLIATKLPNEKSSLPPFHAVDSKLRTPFEDIASSGEQEDMNVVAKTNPTSPVSCNSTGHVVECVSSPCSSDDSDNVFASTVARDKVIPAVCRGDFKKAWRPFKSDSSLPSITGSLEKLSLHSQLSNCKVKPTMLSQTTELVTSDVVKHQPTSNSCSVEVANGVSHNDSNSQIVAEVDNGTNSSSQEWKIRERSNNNEESKEGVSLHKTVDEEDFGMYSASQEWKARKTSVGNETLEGSKGVRLHNEADNWQERPSENVTEPQSITTNENWRDTCRKVSSSLDYWGSGSHNNNWRCKKSMSVDKTTKDTTTATSEHSKRYSTGDMKFERQDSGEKGKRPRGGFGIPKQASQESKESSSEENFEATKSELLEIQISEEESQALHWKKVKDIQIDTGCRIFHNKDKFIVEIRGDPEQCKVAKKRVYSVVAALQEEFGALVPLSDEILEHLQTEGCSLLTERLAVCSGANVKMISDAQLFISGYRTCVNLAKDQLAKIKVMLRYTDDPDISLSSSGKPDSGEEEVQRVDRLFAALEGRPRSLTDQSTTELKPSKGSLTRDFLLSCASSPIAQQRPADLSLERTEDWVKAIVLVNGRRGEEVLLQRKRGFGAPTSNLDSRTGHPSV